MTQPENMLQRASGWLNGQRQLFMAVDVQYRREGTQPALAIKATAVRPDTEQLLESELTINASLQDWIFRTVDFLVAGDFVPPARRDTFTDPNGNQWELVELGGGPCWRYSDPHQHAIRVHAASNITGTGWPQ